MSLNINYIFVKTVQLDHVLKNPFWRIVAKMVE